MNRGPHAVPVRGASGRGAHSRYEALARGLGWVSIGLGLAGLLASRRLCGAFGMTGQENLVRLYGARGAANGVAILASHDPTPWIAGRVIGDAVDLVTLGVDVPEDGPERSNRALAAAALAGVALLDLACARGLAADKRLSPPGRYDYGDRSGFPRPPDAMRGAAADLDVPADFRVPDPLRPWQDGRPAPGTSRLASASTP